VDEHVLVITSVQRDTTTGEFVTAKIRRVLKMFAVDGINYTPSDWLDFVNINVPGTTNRVGAVRPAARSGGLRRVFPTRPARRPGPATTLHPASASGGHTARPVYRNGSLWDVESVQRTVSGETVSAVRWMQLNVSAWPATATFVADACSATAGLDSFYLATMG